VTVAELTEAELIARIQAKLPPAPAWLTVGIGDDAAVVEPERNRLEVLTVDAQVEGIHFDRRFTPPDAIGHRALAVNLSDLAAMGSTPRLALLSLALAPALDATDFEQMIGGVAALALRHRVHVVGGNLTRSSGPLMLDVSVSGSVKRRHVLTRAGAKPGDLVFVTGSIGAAGAGLQMLGASSDARSSCRSRYLYPEPRVATGALLGRNRAASACMDLSDGLADGARQIAAASRVGMVVDADALPIDPDARGWFETRGADPVLEALTCGDDYELLFTVRPQWAGRLRTVQKDTDVPLRKIGFCTRDRAVVLRRGSIETAIPHGYKHFG
jgi:thiamine-monophosphate kinase